MNSQKIKDYSDQYFKIDLCKLDRRVSVIEARGFYYKFCKLYIHDESLKSIGEKVNRHHASVIHNIKRLNDLL